MESWLLKICVGYRNNDHVRCGTHKRAGIQMRQRREGQCSPLVHMMWFRSLFALSHQEAIKIAETPATALAALARQGRGEVRVSTLTPQEREELIKAKQKEISSFLKHAAVEAATRSGLQCKSLMRMRWVITRKSDDSLKARFVTGIHGSTVGSQTYRVAHSLQERTTAVSDGGRVFENGL